MNVQTAVRVRDLMSVPPVVIEPTATLRTIAIALTDEMVGALVVVGEHGPVGIISERDVVTALAGGADPDQVWAADVMSEKPVVVSPEDSLDEVVAAMATHWVRHLPVVDNGKVRGMISVRDVVLALTEPPSETVFSDADDQLAVWEHVEHIEEESLTPEGLEAQLEGFPEAPEEAAMHEEGV